MFNEENDYDNEEYDKEKARIRNLPIYKKAEEIGELVQSICATIDEDKGNELSDILNSMKEMLFADAMLLLVKIGGAEAGGLYEIKMSNAAIIRKAGMDLCSHAFGLDIYGYKYQEYTNLLLEEMEEFRVLFLDWIATFDSSHRGIDRWGLFNPPGVDPNEKDELF